jgi:glycine betaine/proline transport system substrate-binding protein
VVAIATLAACADDGNSGADASPTAAANGERIARPGRPTWSAGYFQAALYAELLEELGFTVTAPAEHEYDPEVAYLEMATGAYDFWANGWYSQHLTHHDEELADGSTVADHIEILGDQIPGGALEGLVVTKSVAEEHGVRSLAQINDDPELVALFDSDGNGLAEVRGCPEDWTCDDIIDETIERNGWSNLEQIIAEYPGLATDSIERVRRGEPVIQYTWSPSGWLAELAPGTAVSWLSFGGQELVIDGTTESEIDYSDVPPATSGFPCTDDPCWLGWELSDIQVTATTSFLEANPDAAELFRQVELTLDDVAQANLRYLGGENTEADVERHAEEWVAENRDVVDGWLAAASAADG